jgi:hypothetical protein
VRLSFWTALAALAFGLPLAFAGAACTTSTSGSGPEFGPEGGVDDATAGDAHPDGPATQTDGGPHEGGGDAAPDTGPSCNGVLCNGACIAATDCRGCTGAKVLCHATKSCVEQCTFCRDDADAAVPIECFACDSTHKNPIGTCEYDQPSTYCLSGNYFGAYAGGPGYVCACDDAGNMCPGATEVCTPLGSGTFCETCGQATTANLQGQACRGGGTCDQAAHTCQ